MAFFSDIARRVDDLRVLLGGDVHDDSLTRDVSALGDDDVVAVIAQTAALEREIQKLRIVATGVASARSARESGHGGLAQKRGHRTPVALVQELTGATRGEAATQVRVGESLVEATAPPAPEPHVGVGAEPVVEPWHAPLSRAVLAGTISATQHDAIQRGLGQPPTPDGCVPECWATEVEPCRCAADAAEAASRVWALAAEQLVAEAVERTVEELGAAARTVRDLLDPEGAQRRFDERFARRSFRMWTDADGTRRGSWVFDPEGGAWLAAIIDAALRPRRGGPRFVDPDEKAAADELASDPRTNEQLAYDLLIDTLRAGALADAETVFGTRQAGVRIVATAAAIEAVDAGRPAVALIDEERTAIPASLAAQRRCDAGVGHATMDAGGNPLFLGRESRLFSAPQRLALALRDGGCRWRGCDRPSSYCEAHHIDPHSEGGRTDVDRGILLCRYHHMTLHHGGWRITRDGLCDFVLHPPPGRGDPIVLAPRRVLRYAWAGIDPPPRRFRVAA